MKGTDSALTDALPQVGRCMLNDEFTEEAQKQREEKEIVQRISCVENKDQARREKNWMRSSVPINEAAQRPVEMIRNLESLP